MPTNHDVWDAVQQTDGTPGNSFEFLIDVFYGGSYKQTADITNVNPAFSPKTRMRNTYGAHGVDRATKYGENLVLTFDVEVVRDANGAFQPLLQALLAASRLVGNANKMKIRAYDALGADYAFESMFTISAARSGTDWDSAAFFTITATQSGTTSWLTNPVLVGNVPVISGVAPVSVAAATAGAHIYIQGQRFTGVTGAASVKVQGVNATSYIVLSDTLIDAIIPAGALGTAAVQVTSPIGVSDPFTGFSRT